MKNNKSKVTILTFLLFIMTIFISIGFSTFQDQLSLSDSVAKLRVQADIRITGVSIVDPISNAQSDYNEYSVRSISSNLTLPNSNSKITYKVEVTNFGNMEMILSSLNDLPSNLKYTLNPDNYRLNEMICDDNDNEVCSLGAKKTIYITISYKDNTSYDSSKTSFTFTLNFNFESADKVAEANNIYYDTLQEAINATPNNTETMVKLLKNTSEIITVPANKIIIFNFQSYTLSNNGNNPVINNNGNITIIGGTVSSNAPANGTINNQISGTITVSGGRIINTGGRQALYNNKGTAYIKGTANLQASTKERGAVQNVTGGLMTIDGGTIISTGASGVVNQGSLTVGTKDGNPNKSSLTIQGASYGIEATSNYTFYDGTIKGKNKATNNNSKIDEIEDNYSIADAEEEINDSTYKISYLAITKTVNFNPNGGSVDPTTKNIEIGNKIGLMPTPIRSGYEFLGWYLSEDGNNMVSENDIIEEDIDCYAHWKKIECARIGNTYYGSLQDAINAAPNNTETIIVLIRNITEDFKVNKNKNIVFDIQNYTITGRSGAVIENYGRISIQNGTITSSSDYSTINNYNGGYINISGGRIISTGTRQAVYNNEGGIVVITGDAYLSSTATGTPQTSVNLERGTVQNLTGGTIIISGGTIVGLNQQAVSNEGTITIGIDDNIITPSPVIIGETYGLRNLGTLYFYDGIIKGINGGIDGRVSSWDSNSEVSSGSEVIDGKTYITNYLS